MIPITLYTKEGCTLCEKVKAQLALLAADNEAWAYQLTEIDITADPDLFARYRFSIPVLHIGTLTLKAPISTPQLAAALSHTQRTSAPS